MVVIESGCCVVMEVVSVGTGFTTVSFSEFPYDMYAITAITAANNATRARPFPMFARNQSLIDGPLLSDSGTVRLLSEDESSLMPRFDANCVTV